MNFEDGVQTLADVGLNIFLSAKVSDLPENIFPFTDEKKKKTLCLVGHGGKTLWENIPDKNADHPIDNFSLLHMQWFSKNILKNEIDILFPNDEFIIPLQQLGRYFNLSHQSPIGIDISSEFGLWFAFRGVFLTDENIPLIKKTKSHFPCESCLDKPCLSATEINHARLKCPVKNEHQYTIEQQQFHHRALANLKKFR